MLKQLDAWHKTGPGYLIFGLAELAAAYGWTSLAIDRGNFWYYFLALVFLAGALHNFAKLIGVLFHVSRPKR
ncbi:MAG TPA: hypothetical protein VD706_03375 [Candidatus Saccharimonadales bacterium]|nr:hypothetical protein [Candidatus Saccharimonadales bacterium]